MEFLVYTSMGGVIGLAVGIMVALAWVAMQR